MSQDELAAICGFPKSYKWPESNFNDISGYMSRGVMPKVGEWLAENVARALEANRRINRPTAEVLDITAPPGRTYPLYREDEGEMPKKTQVAVRTAPNKLPDRDPGEGSGAYIRRLLGLGAETDAILERVHAQFPGSKATKSDVAYNRNKMKRDGEAAPPVIVESVPVKRAPKYAPANPPFDVVSSVLVDQKVAVRALRDVVIKKASTPAIAALLNKSLDVLEAL